MTRTSPPNCTNVTALRGFTGFPESPYAAHKNIMV